MSEEERRLFTKDERMRYQLAKGGAALTNTATTIKGFFVALFSPLTNVIAGLVIVFGYITKFIYWTLRAFFALPTTHRLIYAHESTHGCLVCGSKGSCGTTLVFLYLLFIVATALVFGVAIPHFNLAPQTAWVILGVTNFTSLLHELGRHSRNKKSESATPVSVPAPVNTVAKESSDVPDTPVASPAATSYNAQNIIDCDSTPFTPNGFSVEEHQMSGKLIWDAAKTKLYLDEQQRTGRIGGHDLREKLKDMPVLNANVLDYLLANPHLIPEEWKGKYIYFWGTIYRSSGRGLCVRFLYWYGDRWHWDYRWLGRGWNSLSPAAVRASN